MDLHLTLGAAPANWPEPSALPEPRGLTRRQLLWAGGSRVVPLLAVPLAVPLAACEQVPTAKLGELASPVQAVQAWAWFGQDPAMAQQGAAHLRAVLQRNGLTVSSWAALPKAFNALSQLEAAWQAQPPSAQAKHALVYTFVGTGTLERRPINRYEAVLWEAATGKLVWKATLITYLYDKSESLEQRAERLAGDTLRALGRAGVIALLSDAPRNLKGEAIGATWLPPNHLL